MCHFNFFSDFANAVTSGLVLPKYSLLGPQTDSAPLPQSLCLPFSVCLLPPRTEMLVSLVFLKGLGSLDSSSALSLHSCWQSISAQ